MSTTIGNRTMELPVGFWLTNGAITGVLAGAVAANFFILFMVISLVITDGNKFYNQLLSLFEVVAFYFLFGQLFGTLPAVVLGLVSGMITGLLFRYLQNINRLHSGTMEGFKVTLVLTVILLGVYAWISQGWVGPFANRISVREPYFLSLSSIVLLYLTSGAWGGRRLFRQWQMVRQWQKLVVS